MTSIRTPEAYLACVSIPPRIADILDRRLGLDTIRKQIRGEDAEVDAVLMAIRLAGCAFRNGQTAHLAARSACGTDVVKPAEPESESGRGIGTSTAAEILGVTDRAVRKAIAENRLPAVLDDGGRWRINRDDLMQYRAERRTA